MGLHPCQSCGACCSFFRVQFYWREANAEESERSVPAHLFEELDSQSRCMKGTGRKHRPKCEALQGRIGVEVSCTIYQNRPTPCRAFKASFEDGEPNLRCDEARAAHGITPLRMADWRAYRAPKPERHAEPERHADPGLCDTAL